MRSQESDAQSLAPEAMSAAADTVLALSVSPAIVQAVAVADHASVSAGSAAPACAVDIVARTPKEQEEANFCAADDSTTGSKGGSPMMRAVSATQA